VARPREPSSRFDEVVDVVVVVVEVVVDDDVEEVEVPPEGPGRRCIPSPLVR
jgi:hypothetical protein